MTTNNSLQDHLIRALNEAEPSSLTNNSPYFYLHRIEEHQHSISYVAPAAAAPAALVAGTGSWSATGALTTLIASSIVTSPYDVHFGQVSNLTVNTDYEIHFYYGSGAGTYCGALLAYKDDNFASEGVATCLTPVIAANQKLSARLLSATTNADTASLKIIYHKY